MQLSEKYKNKKILITGGAGAIGSNLLRELSGVSKIWVIDDLSSGFEKNIIKNENIVFKIGSVNDEELLRSVFRNDIDIVFHLAANFANQNSVEYPRKDLLVNGMGTLKLLEYSRDCKVSRFVYCSSSCVYGNKAGILDETNKEYSLDTPYAITKLLGERYCTFFHEYYGLPTVIVRLFNSYGPGEYPGRYRNVIPNFIYYSLRKQPLPITGTGEETRDFTFVADIVDGILRGGIVPDAVGEDFNLGSGIETKIIELARLINEAADNNGQIRFAEKRKWDSISRRLACIDKAKKTLGYSPNISLQEGIQKNVDWFNNNWDKIVESTRF